MENIVAKICYAVNNQRRFLCLILSWSLKWKSKQAEVLNNFEAWNNSSYMKSRNCSCIRRQQTSKSTRREEPNTKFPISKSVIQPWKGAFHGNTQKTTAKNRNKLLLTTPYHCSVNSKQTPMKRSWLYHSTSPSGGKEPQEPQDKKK